MTLSRAIAWGMGMSIGLLPLVAAAAEPSQTPFSPQVHQFVQTYCIECHGPEKQKGDRAFDELTTVLGDQRMIDLSDPDRKHLLEDLLDQLNLGEMPPRKEGVKQPSKEEVAATTKWITDTLLASQEAGQASHTVLRRLNRREYRNTMEDLFGLHDLTFDPTAKFPADDNEEGFINIGEALTLSESHLEQYFDAAEAYLSRGIFFGDPPKVETIKLTPEMWDAPEHQARTPWAYRLRKGDEYFDIGAGEKDLTRKVYLINYPESFLHKGGVQVPGYYTIRVNATAVRRLNHGYSKKRQSGY